MITISKIMQKLKDLHSHQKSFKPSLAGNYMDSMGESGRHMWSHTETLALIDAWEERYDVLRSQRRTAHVHEDIKQALASLNIDKSIRQIVVKIDNLTQKYRKTKYSGRTNPTWIYYKRLDKFMSYPTRYRRRFETDVPSPSYAEDDPDYISTRNEDHGGQSNFEMPPVDWGSPCDADSTFPMPANGQDIQSYHQQLLGIVSNQLEVQKQSLAVQEKCVQLMRTVINASVTAHVPKSESG